MPTRETQNRVATNATRPGRVAPGGVVGRGIDYRALRTAIDIADVLKLLGFVAVKTSGDQVRGPCPIHGSHTASSRVFSANLRKHAFRCFKCGAHGNQLELWAAATRQSLYAAAIDLCGRLDLPRTLTKTFRN